jgi:DNA-binding IclR family transcriptional regulator
MKCNLALILLREAILQAAGEGNKGIKLAWFKRLHKIPNSTFYRHIANLIDEGFLIRESRDNYVLHGQFVERMKNQYTDDIGFDKNWQYIPF